MLLANGTTPGIGAHVAAYAFLAVLVFAAGVAVASIFSPRWRRLDLRAICIPVGTVVALYAVGRGVAEFFVVNYSDPASYAKDWGGPSLAGVFAVHAGPGAAVLIAAGVWLYRRRAGRVRHAGSPAGISASSPRRSQTTPCA
jgi:hypothetical protein